MTRIMILALQSVGFGNKGVMALSLSLEVKEHSYQKLLENLNPQGSIYRVGH